MNKGSFHITSILISIDYNKRTSFQLYTITPYPIRGTKNKLETKISMSSCHLNLKIRYPFILTRRERGNVKRN